MTDDKWQIHGDQLFPHIAFSCHHVYYNHEFVNVRVGRVGRPGGEDKSPGLVTFTLQTTNDGQK